MKERVVVSWSGGKDSALALYKILQSERYIIDSLFTTLTEGFQRISIHGVRETLLDKQAESLCLPLRKMYIPENCSNEIYQERMDYNLNEMKKEGIKKVIFGDIFLEDVRNYREQLLEKHGIKGIFPLWGLNTNELVSELCSLGFKTITTCIDTEKLTSRFLGRTLDYAFIHELPTGVDPCGENGEFHTFTYEGPMFINKINFTIGEYIDKGRFHFVDILD